MTETLPPEERIMLFGECPSCDAVDLHTGPTGGASTNFACFSCGARYNGTFTTIELILLEQTGKLAPEDRHLFSAVRFCGLVEIWRA